MAVSKMFKKTNQSTKQYPNPKRRTVEDLEHVEVSNPRTPKSSMCFFGFSKNEKNTDGRRLGLRTGVMGVMGVIGVIGAWSAEQCWTQDGFTLRQRWMVVVIHGSMSHGELVNWWIALWLLTSSKTNRCVFQNEQGIRMG